MGSVLQVDPRVQTALFGNAAHFSTNFARFTWETMSKYNEQTAQLGSIHNGTK
jgi:hypothetical protein